MTASDELRRQWRNPNDILTLLFLVGGDIVQKAIAQLVGHTVRIPGFKGFRLSVAPVAFSFGWVAYAFSNLLSTFGSGRLMPDAEFESILVNCSNGFSRYNQSWILGRLLRDHESRFEVDSRPLEDGGRAESIRIDVFELGCPSGPRRDLVWWLGWATVTVQIVLAVIAWVVYSDWGIMLVVVWGNILSQITCTLPQWTQEKWAGGQLGKDQVTCLTRGNGHQHIMVFIGVKGSWNFEAMATGTSTSRSETRWISLMLASLWTFLLISVSGLQEHAWFLVAIGGIGMLQNVYAAGASRDSSAYNFHLTKASHGPTIIGKRSSYQDDIDANLSLEEDLENLKQALHWESSNMGNEGVNSLSSSRSEASSVDCRWLNSMAREDGAPEWLVAVQPELVSSNDGSAVVYASNVHGALMELEKWVPSAGCSMVQVFFPAGLQYRNEAIRDNVHKKFWQRAYVTREIRKAAEGRRRAQQESQQRNSEPREKMVGGNVKV